MPFEPRATAAPFRLAPQPSLFAWRHRRHFPPGASAVPFRLAFPLNDFAARLRAGVALAGASGAGRL
jgi:hypothetical protein